VIGASLCLLVGLIFVATWFHVSKAEFNGRFLSLILICISPVSMGLVINKIFQLNPLILFGTFVLGYWIGMATLLPKLGSVGGSMQIIFSIFFAFVFAISGFFMLRADVETHDTLKKP